MRKTIKALLRSSVICLFCVSMLTSSSYAWYTTYQDGTDGDGAGMLDSNGQIATKAAELSWKKAWDDNWNVVTALGKDENAEAIFTYNHWEPGYAQVRYVKLANVGNELLQYYLRVNSVSNNPVNADIARVIDVYFVENPTEVVTKSDLTDDNYVGTLAQLILASSTDTEGVAYGSLNTGKSVTAAIVLKMRESAGNEYQLAVKEFDLQIKLSPFIISTTTL